MKRTLITSALPYANGYLHLGHCAGAYLPADIYARFLRLKGESVLYVCGSDEHGVAITIAAEKEKVTPKRIIDKYHEANREAFQKFGMSFDIYSRTSNDIHHETAREFFADFLNKGHLVEKEEDQFYDTSVQMFLPDRYVEGICPNCGYDKARGDQCDSCGAYYSQLDLINPKSLVSGNAPIVKKSIHWYMKFGNFQNFLEDYIDSHSSEWKDNVIQQSKSWLKQGLTDRAITRDLTWGVSIDKIPGISPEKSKGKALYVWFDAVLGYISATKEWVIERAQQLKGSRDDWKIWWQDPETRYVAFIGKDNIVFHTLIFPSMLHAKGGYILPDNVPANEFLNLEGQKFSKSRNWSIDLQDFIADFPEPQYMDALRYTLAMNFPETKDADFTWRDFQARNNNELSAIFGNFVNRTLQFVNKSFGARVPFISGKYHKMPLLWHRLVEYFNIVQDKPDEEILSGVNPKLRNEIPDNEFQLFWALWKGTRDSAANFNKFRFRDAISDIMNVARAANKYFNDEAPWKTLKDDFETCSKSVYFCCQLVRSLSILFSPVVPFACRRISRMLDEEPLLGVGNGAVKGDNLWYAAALPTIEENKRIIDPNIIFSRIEDDVVEKQIAKLSKSDNKSPAKEESEQKPLITIDDFAKIELRTAKIIEAENVPKSKKLIKLSVQIGSERRQILAGIAEHYKPEQLVGKTIVVVTNLQPAKLMGHESQGMALAATNADGELSLLIAEKDGFGSGCEIH